MLGTRYSPRRRIASSRLFAALILSLALSLSACTSLLGGDAGLTQRTYFELVDWHISGLWVINCPVAWVRVANYNEVPIKNITFQYDTYDYDGTHLDHGTYTVEDSVPPRTVKNFIELYLGLVNLHSERLSVKLLSVSRG